MNYERKFYRCTHCGNVLSLIDDKGVPVVCCGERMQELKANTADAAQEKHLPSVGREGCKLSVKVGSVPHPMTDEHHIGWIAVLEKDRTTRVSLHPGSPAETVFCVGEEHVTVYAYCNLHGLWAIET